MSDVMKHTPGPWLLVANNFVYALNEHKTNRFYLSVQLGYDDKCKLIKMEELEANARLITAAPDMLAALETFVNNFVRLTSTENLDKLTGGPLFEAYKAVKKAKGLPE